MAADAYQDFADRYDLFFETYGKHGADETGFFRELFRNHGVRGVLDCACGTGHDLVLFHGLGLEVVGSDVSDSMLARAERNLAEHGLDIQLVKADYRALPARFDGRFEAVVCLSSSILEMADEGEVVRALRRMREVLTDRGIIVLSQGTTDKQWSEKPRFIPVVNTDDFSRLFVIDYERTGARYNVIDIFHGKGNYDFRVWTANYHIMLLRDDLERLLRQAGFGKIAFYGSYFFEPYDKTSSKILIAVAER
jgi:ubiquinone/menaquinone biosynthesis C-methylase UbiE